jgi:hypothetical protein
MEVYNKIYKCHVTNYFIEFSINEDTAFIETIETNFEYPKALANLLRTSYDDLNRIGIKKIRQMVVVNDWVNYLKDQSSWRLVGSIDNMHVIESDIDSFLQNMCIGLGY